MLQKLNAWEKYLTSDLQSPYTYILSRILMFFNPRQCQLIRGIAITIIVFIVLADGIKYN